MNLLALTPEVLFPYRGAECSDDSFTPYNLSVLILVAEYFELRKKAAANQNGYRTLLKGLKLLSTGGGGVGAVGGEKDESYAPPASATPALNLLPDETSSEMLESSAVVESVAESPRVARLSNENDGIACDSFGEGDENEAPSLTEKCKRDFAMLLLSLLHSGEMEFGALAAKVRKVASPRFCEDFKSRVKEVLEGGVHSLFDFRETGIEALLQESSADSSSKSIHKSSIVGLFLRRMNLAFKTLEFPQIVRLYESTVSYVSSCLKLSTSSKSKICGLLPSAPKIRFQLEAEESNFAEKSEIGTISRNSEDEDIAMQLEDSILTPRLKPKHVSTPFVPSRKEVGLDEEDEPEHKPCLPFPLSEGFTFEDGGSPSDASRASSNRSSSAHMSRKQVEYFIATQVNLLVHNETKALKPKPLQSQINELLSINPDTPSLHYLSFLNAVRCNEYNAAVHALHHYFDRQHPKAFVAANSRNAALDGGVDSHLDHPKNYRYGTLNLAAMHHRFSHHGEALAALHEAIQMAQEAGDAICLQYALGWLHLIIEESDGLDEDQRKRTNGTNDFLSLSEMITRGIKKSNELLLPFLSSLGIQSLARQLALSSDPTKPYLIFEGMSRSDVFNCQHSILSLMSASFAQKAALWRMYGKTNMAALSTQALLQLNSLKHGTPQMGLSEVLALAWLAEHHASHGAFSAVDAIFAFLRDSFPVGTPTSVAWLKSKHRIDFARALGHGDLVWASAEASNLSAIDSAEGALFDALLLLEKTLYSESLSRLFRLLESIDKRSSETARERALLRVHALLKIGEVYCQMNDPASAVEFILKALTTAEARHIDNVVALAKVLIALTQYQLEMPNQALSVLDSCFFSVLTHGTPDLQGRAFFLKSRCHVATTASFADDVAARETSFRLGILNADRALSLFLLSGDFRRARQALMFLSQLHHHLKEFDARNLRAKQFRAIEETSSSLSEPAAQIFRVF